MQKCLQLLPLCYGVDGVINWKIYSDVLTRDEGSDTYYVPYEASPTVTRPGTYHWYGLINKDTSGVLNLTPQYASIIEANEKLLLYGPILKSLDWVNAGYLDRSGINLQSDIYVEDSTISVSSYLSSLTALDTTFDHEHPQASNPYDGYIQAGLFRESEMIDSNPYYMLVNRRTDFVDDPSGRMMTLTPHQLLTSYDSSGHADGFSLAPSQNVIFTPNTASHSRFGDFIGLYDPFDNHVYPEVMSVIDVEIAPGDGKLLEMCGTLPEQVTSDITLRNKVYLSGEINVLAGKSITVEENTELVFLPNTLITLNRGANLSLSGNITFGDGVRFTILDEASVNIADAVCSYEGTFNLDGSGSFTVADSSVCTYSNTYISGGCDVVLSGSHTFRSSSHITVTEQSALTIEDATLNLGHSVEWRINDSSLHCSSSSILSISLLNSLFVENQSAITINNSEIRKLPIIVNDSGLYMNNSLIKVSNDKSGIVISNPNPFSGCQVHLDSTQGRNEISGISTPDPQYPAKGLEILITTEPIVVRNTDFSSLNSGIVYASVSTVPDSIYNCSFTDCINGINSITNGVGGRIEDCSFSNVDSCIKVIGSIPTINNCEFDDCGTGVYFDGTFSSPRLSGIYNSSFVSCATAIESRFSNPKVQNCNLSMNNIGLLCHNESNADLSYGSYNSFSNTSSNIAFNGNEAYRSNIQLSSGHNNFYHSSPTSYDLSFDWYFNSRDPIDVSRNWFDDFLVRTNISEYVVIRDYDPFPYLFMSISNPDNRYLIALQSEADDQYDQAILQYQAIVDEQLEVEKDYVNGCIDGIYRIQLTQGNQISSLSQYLEQKIEQYALVDSSYTKLITDYLVKTKVVSKEYQYAINLVQYRIDNPVTAIDSLQAVLDLEIILQLASMDETKRPLTTKYTQYRYPSTRIFRSNHEKHLKMLNNLLNKTGEDEIEVPSIPMISKNYPNPFNPTTTIAFSVPIASKVKISVYNIRGQKVRDITDAMLDRGFHKVVWDGTDNSSSSVGSGIYFIRLESGGKNSLRKVMLVK